MLTSFGNQTLCPLITCKGCCTLTFSNAMRAPDLASVYFHFVLQLCNPFMSVGGCTGADGRIESLVCVCLPFSGAETVPVAARGVARYTCKMTVTTGFHG